MRMVSKALEDMIAVMKSKYKGFHGPLKPVMVVTTHVERVNTSYANDIYHKCNLVLKHRNGPGFGSNRTEPLTHGLKVYKL